jgi:hypothetical protein
MSRKPSVSLRFRSVCDSQSFEIDERAVAWAGWVRQLLANRVAGAPWVQSHRQSGDE